MKYFISVLLGLIIFLYNIPTLLLFTAISIWHWDEKYFYKCCKRISNIIGILFEEE